MNILITGAGGMLGQQAVMYFSGKYNVIFADHNRLDITNFDNIRTFFSKYRPDYVLNCAAIRNEYCGDIKKALDINASGACNLALLCSEYGSKFVYVSTDYVFNGQKGTPYKENDLCSPVNNYGISKYFGEKLISNAMKEFFIVRTSCLYGRFGSNFVDKIIAKAYNSEEIDVVDNVIGSPTSVSCLLDMIYGLINTDKFGIYHAVCSGCVSRHELAAEIVKILNLDCKINKIYADRTFNSGLSNKKITDVLSINPGSWHNALKEYLTERKLV